MQELRKWGHGICEYGSYWALHYRIGVYRRILALSQRDSWELRELVLTSLGRFGAPALRYRTGDLVQPKWNDEGSFNFVELIGGVLARADQMMTIRGVNVFPSSIEAILREFSSVAEFRLIATRKQKWIN